MRAIAGLICFAAFATVVARIYLNIDATGNTVPEALWVIYRFFTVWTNTLVGVVCGWIALGGRPPQWMPAGLALAIAMVGAVYHAVLAQLVSYAGLALVADVMFHTAIPVGFVLFWAALLPKDLLGARNLVQWLGYPLVYCVYAIGRGAVDGEYPYPFLNVAELGAAAVAVNVAGLLVAFVLGSLLLLGIARFVPRKGAY